MLRPQPPAVCMVLLTPVHKVHLQTASSATPPRAWQSPATCTWLETISHFPKGLPLPKNGLQSKGLKPPLAVKPQREWFGGNKYARARRGIRRRPLLEEESFYSVLACFYSNGHSGCSGVKQGVKRLRLWKPNLHLRVKPLHSG